MFAKKAVPLHSKSELGFGCFFYANKDNKSLIYLINNSNENKKHLMAFRATITGRTLEITSGTHDARVIVRNSSNMQVLDRQFVGGTIEQLPAAGNYSLEIQSGSLTLVGVFEAE